MNSRILYIFVVQIGLMAASVCDVVTSQPLRFSFCKPQNWVADLGLKGIPYLCSKRVSGCTLNGGTPRSGLALLQLVPVEASGYPTSARTPEELIQREEVRGAAPINRLVMRLGEKRTFNGISGGTSVHYIRLEQQSFSGPTDKVVGERYVYAVDINERLFWVFLQFWSDDPKAQEYLETTDGVIQSIRLLK